MRRRHVVADATNATDITNAPVKVVEEERKIPLIIGQNPIMAKTRRKPLVASAVTAPLVEAKLLDAKALDAKALDAKALDTKALDTKPKNRTRRKPRVAANVASSIVPRSAIASTKQNKLN